MAVRGKGASRSGRAGLAVLGALAAVAITAVPASAQVSCEAAVDDELIAGHDSPDNPLELEAGSSVRVRALAPDDATRVRVEADVPFATQVIDEPATPGAVFDEVVDLDDVAPYGVGLYRARVESGSCSSTVWVKITGRSPFTTAAGVSATIAIGVGALLIVSAIVRTARGNRSLVRGFLGGALTGFGALVLAQQFGAVGLTDRVLITWIGLPGLAGAALTQASALIAAGAPVAAPVPPPSVPAPAPPAPAPAPAPSSIPAPTSAPPPAAAPASAQSQPIDLTAEATSAEATSEAAAPVGAGDPPRSSYARIDAPDAVVADDEFVLVVGLSAEPVAGVVGGPLVRPPTSIGPYTLVVQAVADGFALADGGSWRRELPVTVAEPYPTVTYRLRADRLAAEVWSRSIQALFSVDGQTMGMAVRSVAIVARRELLGVVPESGPDAERASVVGVAPQRDAADLTVRIVHGESTSGGRLLWTFESTVGVVVPDAPIASDIGSHPADFARQLIAGVAAHRGKVTLVPFLNGIGETVSEQMPAEFFTLLAAVATRVEGRSPRVLLLSEEPYVPWELAALDPLLDPSAPAFLSAQTDVGRWVLGQRRPALPPPRELDIGDVAVVSGEYPTASWRLVEAEAEAAEITQRWSAWPVNAVATSVLDCLTGTPPADVIHFAVHGSYAPEGVLEGLILVDGDTLDPMAVKGCRFAHAPLVFLNACQVGSSNEVLGDYAGLAEAFLHAGAVAVIAPLWSIDDAAAKDLALRFYAGVFDEGRSPAAVLRDERCGYNRPGADVAATRLAYQYFGHPALQCRVRHPTFRRTP